MLRNMTRLPKTVCILVLTLNNLDVREVYSKLSHMPLLFIKTHKPFVPRASSVYSKRKKNQYLNKLCTICRATCAYIHKRSKQRI